MFLQNYTFERPDLQEQWGQAIEKLCSFVTGALMKIIIGTQEEN